MFLHISICSLSLQIYVHTFICVYVNLLYSLMRIAICLPNNWQQLSNSTEHSVMGIGHALRSELGCYFLGLTFAPINGRSSTPSLAMVIPCFHTLCTPSPTRLSYWRLIRSVICPLRSELPTGHLGAICKHRPSDVGGEQLVQIWYTFCRQQ